MSTKLKIIRNSIVCLDCNEELVSKHRWDFKRCTCGKVCVDGGFDYCKRSIADDARWKDTSIWRDEEGNILTDQSLPAKV
jgi:hypothetical protein